ncbi:tRNA (cytidine(56)-2'-O)-methyltransferase [Candidatus Micrarchaeota archaeon]|nr:tRNA (cytidine(56)-2'-O)-methyltransferase [Candidatus Micrarchaeota archaeon]
MITILRLGHRIERDKRITTHCGLVARALLADRFILCGEKDESILESLRSVTKKWGGKFKVSYEPKPQSFLKRQKRALKIHLTFYGEDFEKKIPKIKPQSKGKSVIVIIGSEKVPTDVYYLVDYNLSVTRQPHSEVAALALFLDRWNHGQELSEAKQKRAFKNAKVQIVPQAKGKHVIKR